MTAFTWNFDIYVYVLLHISQKKRNKMVELGSEQASDTTLFLKNYKSYDYH